MKSENVELLKGKKKNILNVIGMCLIVIFSVLYSQLYSNFAEIHITLTSLNFPIFVGEILLAACLLIFCIQAIITPKSLRQWKGWLWLLIIFYFIFVLSKAFFGYAKWGPLAFRNAAMFYYPLFLVLAYYFFNKNLFKKKSVIFIILAFLALSRLLKLPYSYYMYIYLMAGISVLSSIDNKRLKYIAFAVFFLVFPYPTLFNPSRSMFIGSIVAFTYVSLALLFIAQIKLRYKIIIPASVMIICLFMTFLFTQRGILKSLNLSLIVKEYLANKRIVDQKKEQFQPKDFIKSEVFYPAERTILFNFDTQEKYIERKLRKQQAQLTKLEETKVNLEKEKAFIQESAQHQIESEQNVEKINRQQAQLAKLEETKVNLEKEKAFIQESAQHQIENSIEASKPIISSNGEFNDEDIANLQKEIDLLKDKRTNIKQQKEPKPEEVTDASLGNALWRIFVCTDMLEELFNSKKILGIDFGKPFRSKSIEVLHWGDGSWVGWLEPHNSAIHILYRAGIVGFLFIIATGWIFISMLKCFIKKRNIKGILLSSAIFHLLIISNFMVVLELPYFAIPFWSLFGMTLAYAFKGE